MKRMYAILGLVICAVSYAQTVSVKINDSITYQDIVGFGWHGSMDPWWESGPFYDATYLNNVVDDIGMTMNRNNYHAYNTSWYTTKQKDYFTALRTKAQSSNEPMFFIQTVWCPPTQWKANNSECDNTCSSLCNAQANLGPCNGKNNILKPEYYDDYVNQCVSYIKQLKTDCGIDMYAFSLQNEPAFNEPYESCQYTPQTYNDLLKVAGPVFRAQVPNVKLFGAEDMGGGSTLAKWTSVIFNDPVSVNYLDVCAVHGYTDGVTASTGDAPGWTAMYSTASSKKKQLWMTETSGYSSTWTGSPGAFDAGKAIYMALKHGKISAWTWWQFGSPTMTSDKLYHVFKSFYRYIRPFAYQIESSSSSSDVFVVAFKNGGNSSYSAVKTQFTVVLINNSTSSKTVNISGRGIPATMKAYRTSSTEACVALADANTSSVSLPASSITTLVYQSVNKSPTIAQPADVVIVKNTASKTVSLTNVTVGNGETGTPTLTAVSSDKTLIPGAITITGTAPNYTLSFSPAANLTGNATIKIFAKDNGTDILNTTVTTVNVKVIPFINAAPTMDAVQNYTVGLSNKSKKHYIWFNGITDGNDGSQTIIKPELTLSNASALRLPFVNYTAGNSYATMEFYPDQLGMTTVTVKLSDNGGTDLGGSDTKTLTFTITVVADAPVLGENDTRENVLAAFPNPASDLINVILPGEGFSLLQVADMTGKIVLEQSITADQMQLDATGLNNGVYFIIAKGIAGTAKAKVFVQK